MSGRSSLGRQLRRGIAAPPLGSADLYRFVAHIQDDRCPRTLMADTEIRGMPRLGPGAPMWCVKRLRDYEIGRASCRERV